MRYHWQRYLSFHSLDVNSEGPKQHHPSPDFLVTWKPPLVWLWTVLLWPLLCLPFTLHLKSHNTAPCRSMEILIHCLEFWVSRPQTYTPIRCHNGTLFPSVLTWPQPTVVLQCAGENATVLGVLTYQVHVCHNIVARHMCSRVRPPGILTRILTNSVNLGKLLDLSEPQLPYLSTK